MTVASMANSTMFQTLGDIVKTYSFDFPPHHMTDFSDSLGGAWFVSPTHHGLELVFLVPLFLAFTFYFGNQAFGKHTLNHRLLTSVHAIPKATWVERLLLALTIFSFGTTVVHKAVTDTLLFLMQPCHISAFLLIVVMVWPFESRPWVPRLLLNIYYYTLWGAILALIFPDLRDHDMFLEIFNFYLEHVLDIVVPLYLINNPRYVTLAPSPSMALFSFFLYAAYHSPVLHVCALWSGLNLNYTLVPPALDFLIHSGVYYRYVMYSAALLNMFWTRYLVMDNAHKLQQKIAQYRKLKFT
ncbi:TMEM164 family-domain-containing protein [Gongronella butleri]|nr:TMEM164 family-domain-containing protein [Gongronella butleri]